MTNTTQNPKTLAEIEAVAAQEARPITAGLLAELRDCVKDGFAGSSAERIAAEILFGVMVTDPTHDDVWDLIDEVMA